MDSETNKYLGKNPYILYLTFTLPTKSFLSGINYSESSAPLSPERAPFYLLSFASPLTVFKVLLTLHHNVHRTWHPSNQTKPSAVDGSLGQGKWQNLAVASLFLDIIESEIRKSGNVQNFMTSHVGRTADRVSLTDIIKISAVTRAGAWSKARKELQLCDDRKCFGFW